MEPEVGRFYMDNEENVYLCLHRARSNRTYEECVMMLQGHNLGGNAYVYCVFYRTNYAWLDRENPEFRLIEEVDYYPHMIVDPVLDGVAIDD